jgi:nucleotide-binding universal stress UspA family protein
MSAPRILVAGVATLDSGDPVLRPALRLAERTGAELHLVHARPAGDDHPALHEMAALARLRAEAGALPCTARVRCRVERGTAEEVLPRVTAGVGADALLLAPTRRGRLAGALLGTTADHVLRHATVPVLVLHGEPAFHRVLLTTDLSAQSLLAHAWGLRLACALAASARPALRTLYVVPPASLEETVEVADADVTAAVAELADVLAGHAVDGCVPAACVRFGEPGQAIVHEARAWSADLLVLGTHARRGAARRLLGSVARTVLRRAPCSVLVIPPAHVPAECARTGA